MKHLFQITCTMCLGILLSAGTMAHAQSSPIIANADSSYNQSVIYETFCSYIDTIQELPTDDEAIQAILVSFFELDLFHKNNFGIVVIKNGDATSKELDEKQRKDFEQRCVEVVKQKSLQNKSQQEPQQKEKPKAPKRDMPLTYRQLALRIGIGVIIALVVAAIVILLVRAKKKKEKSATNFSKSLSLGPATSSTSTSFNTTNDIIVRRTTTTVMHKQNIDDVVNNGNYMVLNCNEFCNDTAVKTMYIKNSCIMDIYNRYADDLRNPNNPKEDGCMVLGRWIHDEKLDEYAVTLEEIVLPGDDAVFAEYELDFGGKIKVKVNERLRKLRRETDLQYDLTCWIHSHPGLGVFFSNTDCNLHLLHKHSTHPKLLTAIVVDILTPKQELGVFTFKHDMGINSKADLKQLYSLEEWYKWAVDSKRNSTIDEEHIDALENAKSKNTECQSIRLSNSTIIDMDLIAANPNRNSLYFVHGFSIQQSNQTTHVAALIKDSDTLADHELVGCFMVVTHRSYPTIKNALGNYLDKIKFALVYSIADGMLSSIPVISNELSADESFYGKQPLEELKIWTRRKR